MLTITDNHGQISWHFGEPWPYVDSIGPVTFIADGDELTWLLELIQSERYS